MRFPNCLKTSMVVVTTLVASSFAHAGTDAARYPDRLRDSTDPGVECVAEAAAFMEVAGLAHSFRSDGELFAGALYDLREQLFDCLAATEEGPNPDLSSDRDGFGQPI